MGNKIILQMPISDKPFVKYGQMSLFVTELNRVLNQMLSANDDLPYRNPNLPTEAEKAWLTSSITAGGAVVQPGTAANDILIWNNTTHEWENKLRSALSHAYLGDRYWPDSGHNAIGVGMAFCFFDSGGAPILAKCTLHDTDNPGVNDDGAHGYTYFSLWCNLLTGKWFICRAPDNGAAVWDLLN